MAKLPTCDQIVGWTQQILDKYGDLIEQYHLDIPVNVVAARIWRESSGNPKAYAKSTGEAGLLQVWPWVQEKYGVTDPYDPAQNIEAGCKHWSSEVYNLRHKLEADYNTVPRNDSDFWSLAYLYTAIGSGATARLLKESIPLTDQPYAAILSFVENNFDLLGTMKTSNGKSPWGTQSPQLIYDRVRAAGQWTKSAMNGCNESGPSDDAIEESSGGLFALLSLALLGGSIWYYFKKKRT
jgi:hypothetical protein